MENLNDFKETFKMVVKSKLKGAVSNSLDKHSAELIKIIQDATDGVADKILDETRIEEIAKAAKQGATYVAIQSLIKRTAEDAIKEAEPMISQVSQEFARIITEATLEAIVELIKERLQNTP